MQTSDLVHMKQLEAENTQMRRVIARKALEIDAVKELISKNGWRRSNEQWSQHAGFENCAALQGATFIGPKR